ncbi:MAG: HAMP domain-containing sensor histidine kinase [Candidatus Pseudobacter hemicellulosilyticus]|uniref:histidine kinase n=1 Tax=Candidatus Pseudobacter hemicellulosilyticus TaxID=3121375 RepID=A0AAJ5WVA8_9BACT|nr:MAG: HAMP domain-containing sensor histidine kinase [Pseudobacter sp.]
MNKSRIHISVALMLLAILAVAAFQVYWLYKSYREAELTLQIRTNSLFRETVVHLQQEKLRQDSSLQIRLPEGTSPEGLARILRGYITDSVAGGHPIRRMITLPEAGAERMPDSAFHWRMATPGNDPVPGEPGVSLSVTRRMENRPGDGTPSKDQVVVLARGIPSFKDSLSSKDLTLRTDTAFRQEGITVPFAISVEKNSQPPGGPRGRPGDPAHANIAWGGFGSPYSYKIELADTTPYLLRQLVPQFVVSLLLVGLTVLSFGLLLRNFIQQRRLTQLKNDLISNITHELKTPIATVSVAIEALKSFNALHDPRRTLEYLDISSSELQRLSLLVDKVLKLSMFEKQQIQLREDLFDLREVVEEVMGSMRLQFDKYHATVTLQLEGDDFTLKGDRLHITSVVYNLLDNALKYSQGKPCINILLASKGRQLEMSVADNGIGIAPEYRKKIFDKFFRIPTGDTHNVKGYGLGLSYVSYVMQRHKGRITVASEPGQGSCFTLQFPAAA